MPEPPPPSPSLTPAMLDTNVVIYTVDANDDARHGIATQLLADLTAGDALLLSLQTCNELYRNLVYPKVKTNRLNRAAFSHEDAISLLEGLLAASRTVVSLTPEVCLRGYRLAHRHSIQLWDALILSSAIEAGAATIYTEDIPAAAVPTGRLELVHYVNPFAGPEP